jgi:hypothetical protein
MFRKPVLFAQSDRVSEQTLVSCCPDRRATGRNGIPPVMNELDEVICQHVTGRGPATEVAERMMRLGRNPGLEWHGPFFIFGMLSPIMLFGSHRRIERRIARWDNSPSRLSIVL